MSAVFEDSVGRAKEWIDAELAGRIELVHLHPGPDGAGLRPFRERIERDTQAAALRP